MRVKKARILSHKQLAGVLANTIKLVDNINRTKNSLDLMDTLKEAKKNFEELTDYYVDVLEEAHKKHTKIIKTYKEKNSDKKTFQEVMQNVRRK